MTAMIAIASVIAIAVLKKLPPRKLVKPLLKKPLQKKPPLRMQFRQTRPILKANHENHPRYL